MVVLKDFLGNTLEEGDIVARYGNPDFVLNPIVKITDKRIHLGRKVYKRVYAGQTLVDFENYQSINEIKNPHTTGKVVTIPRRWSYDLIKVGVCKK